MREDQIPHDLVNRVLEETPASLMLTETDIRSILATAFSCTTENSSSMQTGDFAYNWFNAGYQAAFTDIAHPTSDPLQDKAFLEKMHAAWARISSKPSGEVLLVAWCSKCAAKLEQLNA